ncbi:LysR family transcriptional regulator [Halioxenophilus aromaticivorans]
MLKRTAKLPLLDIDVLRTFVAIADTGNFTQAAKNLAKTPAAVSLQIKKLERILESRLLRRSARYTELTAEGEVLLQYSRKLLHLNNEAVGQFLSPALTGTLTLGVPDNVGTHILPPVLAQLAQTHPALHVDVLISTSRDLAAKLDIGQLDLALITTGFDASDASGEIIHHEQLVWAERAGGLAHTRSPLPLALANQGCAWRGSAINALEASQINYRIAYTSENCAGIEAALTADLAISPMPASSVKPPLSQLSDQTCLPELPQFAIRLLVGDSANPAVDLLADYIRGHFS